MQIANRLSVLEIVVVAALCKNVLLWFVNFDADCANVSGMQVSNFLYILKWVVIRHLCIDILF